MTIRTRILTAALSGLALAALSACDIRDPNAVDPEPAPEPTATASQAPVTSIIREDIEESEPMIEVPADPVEIVIPFADSGSELSENAERLLVSVLESEAMEEDWPIVLGGHTDTGGNDRANLRASRARAEAVAAWLVERGVDDDRIEVIAFGEQNPIAPNALPDGEPNEVGRAKNRRVEISIAPPEPVAQPTETPTPSASGTPKAGASPAVTKEGA